MATLKESLFSTLEDLVDGDFKKFKWFLNSEKPPIPKGRLDKADRMDTVDLMVQTYCTDTQRVTVMVLGKMNKTDLVKKFSKNSPVSEGQSYIYIQYVCVLCL
uniref:Pyrin domain-containing protein n=1 Tax=Sphaeramia orbicularis TaxID=375764 RepID=A0A672YIH3_9TELE